MQQALELLVGLLDSRTDTAKDPCAVDHRVEAVEVRDRVTDSGFHTQGRGDVDREAPHVRRIACPRRTGQVARRHRGTAIRKQVDDRTADPAGGAYDDGAISEHRADLALGHDSRIGHDRNFLVSAASSSR